ncbi:MAG TPA: outer membrane beta-barrel protein [Vicinamibacterales bacterium]|nr:outer membrane beta-barrel protein [Vicinamibacterales bacterium]
MWRRLIVGLGCLAGSLAASAPAQAQDQTFGVTLGYFALRGEDGRVDGDVLNANRCIDVTFACEPLFFEVSDFNGATIGAEWLIGITEFLEAGASIGFQQRTVPSIYDLVTFPDGSEIEQDLKLRIVPVTATIRFLPTGRGSGFQPYIGAGVGLLNWRYSETGEFVDVFTDEIFAASFSESGTTFAPIILGGVRAPVADVWLIGGEVRWQRADAPLPEDFVGERIDLGGLTFQAVFGYRF